MLPSELSIAIAELNAHISGPELARAAVDLSFRYRETGRTRLQLTAVDQAAYLLMRLPATYAVLSRVLRETQMRVPDLRVGSMLDLGAGPGTTMWAAAEQFPQLGRIVLVENSAAWIEIGKRLSAKSGSCAIRSADWQKMSVVGALTSESFDLVTASYLMNELPAFERVNVAQVAWERTKKLLVIIEPGTPKGFANVSSIRQRLIDAGGYMVAPCPHLHRCPMGIGDWCHFSERLERTAEHRIAKQGELGYEDEKYSYVVFSREPVVLPTARILRHPKNHSGHVELELCTPEGLKRTTISRKQG